MKPGWYIEQRGVDHEVCDTLIPVKTLDGPYETIEKATEVIANENNHSGVSVGLGGYRLIQVYDA